MANAPQKFESTLESVKDLSSNTKHFVFTVPEGFTFIPGQFVMVGLPGEDGKPIRRAFSIASTPDLLGKIELCIKILSFGKLSSKLGALKPGQTVTMEGPYGKFILQEDPEKEIILLAAGTGIAPIRSMLHTLISRGCKLPIKLLFGFHAPRDFLYQEELEQLATSHDNVTLVPIASTPDESWDGRTGHTQDNFDLIGDGEGKSAYLCGPPKMVSQNVELLSKQNFKRIYREAWG